MKKQALFLSLLFVLASGCQKSSGKSPIVQPETSEQPKQEELSLAELGGQPLESLFSSDFPFVLKEDEFLIFDSAKDCLFDLGSSSWISCSLQNLTVVGEAMEDLRVSEGEVFGLFAGICSEDSIGFLNDSRVTFTSDSTLFSLTNVLSSDQIDLESFIDFKFSKDLSASTANRCKIAFLGAINTPDALDSVYRIDIETIIRNYHFYIDEIEKLDTVIAKVSNSKNTDFVHGKLRGLSRVAKELRELREKQVVIEIPDDEFATSATLCDIKGSSLYRGFESELAFWSLPNSENCTVYVEIEESYRTEGNSIPAIFRFKDSEGDVLGKQETYFFSWAFFNKNRWGTSFRDFPVETRRFEVEIIKIVDSKLTVYKKEFAFNEPNSVNLDFDFIEEAELLSANSESAEIRYKLNPDLIDIAPHSSFDIGDLWVCFTKSETPLTPLELVEQGKGACGRMFGFLAIGRFSFTETKVDFGRFRYWNSTLFDQEVNAYLYSEEAEFSTFEPRGVFYPLGKVTIPKSP